MKTKRILALLLTVVLVLGMLPTAVLAEEANTVMTLPEKVQEDLTASGAGIEHVYAYHAADYSLWVDCKLADDEDAASGKAARLAAEETYYPADFTLTEGQSLPVAQEPGSAFGTIPYAELKANEGKGYQIYKFEDVAFAENLSSVWMFNWYLENTAISELKGKTVDLYISLKVEGTLETDPVYYVDQMIALDSCADYIEEDAFTLEKDATCTENKKIGAECPTCGNIFWKDVPDTALGHDFSELVLNPLTNQYEAECANGCGAKNVYSEDKLPAEIVDALEETGSLVGHVRDYHAENFSLWVDCKLTDDADSILGKAARLAAEETYYPADFVLYAGEGLPVAQEPGSEIGRIPYENLKANLGKGYQLYKFENVTFTEDLSSVWMFNWYLENTEISELKGKTVDLYISLKVEGTLETDPVYFVDRMIALDSCADYVGEDDFREKIPADCLNDAVWAVTCPQCEKEHTKVLEDTALGHDMEITAVITPATCTKDAYVTVDCTRCDFTEDKTDEGSALGHDLSDYVYTDGAYEASCSRCHVAAEKLVNAPIPEGVLDDVNQVAHLYDYDAADFTVTEPAAVADDADSVLGKAIVLDMVEVNKGGTNSDAIDPLWYLKNNWPLKLHDVNGNAVELPVKELKANAGKGYQLYHLANVKADGSEPFGFLTFQCLQSTVVAADMKELSGKTVDLYISMKIEGDMTETAVCYIDRMIMVESCSNYIAADDYTDADAATCTEHATQSAVCPECGGVDIKVLPNTALGHTYDQCVYNKELGRYEAICIRECGSKEVQENILAPLPVTVLNDLNDVAAVRQHVYDYSAEDLAVGTVTVDKGSFFGKAVKVDSKGNVDGLLLKEGESFPVSFGSGEVVGKITYEQLKANAGKGYCIYKLSGKFPNANFRYLQLLGNQVQNSDTTKLYELKGKSFDLYISLKVKGDISKDAVYYVDRMIILVDCDDVDCDGCDLTYVRNNNIVTFDTNGGTAVETKFVEFGSPVKVTEKTTKTGYVFDGWYLGEELYDFSEIVTEDMELTAKWLNAYCSAVSTNSDSYGTLSAEGDTVTLTVEGEIPMLSEPTGRAGYWVGFLLTAPAGFDTTKITVTAPNGNSYVLEEVKDGDYYANFYWNLANSEDRVVEYTIDWGRDDATAVTVVVDASAAILGEDVAVAAIGKNNYASLEDALTAAQAGETVKLLTDVVLTDSVKIAKKVTIDLNGKNITGAVDSAYGLLYVSMAGDLTVTDSTVTVDVVGGKIANETGITVGNYGKVTVAGGTLSCGDDKKNDAALYNFYYDAATSGTAVISGGYVKTVWNCGAATVDGGVVDYIDSSAALTVNGGVITELLVKEADYTDVPAAATINGGEIETLTAEAKIGNVYYASLADALTAAKDGETVVLMKSTSGEGIVIDKDVTIDFGGYTYTFTGGVGSYDSCGFQILKDNTVVLKNGTLNVAEESKAAMYMLVQNYADLTITDMVLDGTNLDKWSGTDGDSYTLSNNSGNVTISGKTDIIANDEGDLAYALDACKYGSYETPTVTVNTTGTITGNVEVTGGTLDIDAATINGKLVYTAGTVTKAETVTLAAPEGYEWVEGTLTAINYVAEVNSVKYKTLAEAVANAAAGAVVKLLADNDEAVEVAVALTIVRNGFTASGLKAAEGYEIKTTEETYIVAEKTAVYGISDSMQAFLSLESIVQLNVGFKMTADGAELTAAQAEEVLDKVGLLVWKGETAPADATVESCEIILKNATFNAGKGRFEVKSDGIPAKELGDALCFRPFFRKADGTYIYGRLIENYSPKKYCYGQIKANGTDKAVNIALLNYGAAAQDYFNYNEANLMNADLTEDQKALNWDGSLVRTDWAIPADKEGELTRDKDQLTGRGGYLSLEGTIDVNFYYKTNVSVAAAEILLWDEEAYNAADVLTEANASRIEDLTWMEGKSRYEYKYEGVAAKEMFTPIYACAKITDTDGNVYYSGVLAYCAERYVSIDQNNANTALATLVRSMAIYGDAARTYFG